MTKCERCGANSWATTCSMFNMQMICWECKTREKEHPQYKAAREAETNAVLSGDYNFPGVGLPKDLE